MNDNLIGILQHAIQTVPYYKKTLAINSSTIGIDQFPILYKDFILNSKEDFISDFYNEKYRSGRLLMKKTSGSTGKCLEVYWSINDDAIANFEIWKYRKQWYNVSIKDRYVSFHTTLYIANRFVEKNDDIIERGVNLSLSKKLLNNKNIHSYIERIKEFEPTWMLIQPSVLHIILSLSSEKEINTLNKLKYIELTGEYLTASTRQYFKDTLPNVNFANMYGTTETGSIALECPCGHMHILNNAFVEVVDKDNIIKNIGEGKILLTGYRNRAMPFIRYNIGDTGSITNSDCCCGFDGYDISIALGREGDIVKFPQNVEKACYVFLYPIEKVNYEYNNPITQFHVEQQAIDKFTIHLSIKKSYQAWKNTITNAIVMSLKNDVCDNVEYNCIFHDENEVFCKNKLKFYTRLFD